MNNSDELYVDISKVKSSQLKNTYQWRREAAYFKLHGVYTKYPRSKDPNSPYYKYWVEQARRSVYGYTTEDNVFLPGYYYFYLNFCQIKIVEPDEDNSVIGIAIDALNSLSEKIMQEEKEFNIVIRGGGNIGVFENDAPWIK